MLQLLRTNLTERRAEQFRLLSDLIRIDSANPPGDGEASAQLLEATLESLGFETQRFEPPSDLTQPMGLIAAPTIVARWSGGEGPTLALVAGLDTPVSLGDAAEPRLSGEIKDGVIHGDGSSQRKSSAVAFIYGALAAIETLPLNGSIDLVFTQDSESGGYVGSSWLLDDNIIRRPLHKARYGAGFQHN